VGNSSEESSLLTELGAWLCKNRRRIEQQVHVRVQQRSPRQTVVSIDHRLAYRVADYPGWKISTHKTLLPRSQFSSYSTAQIKGASGRGRAIYCLDLLLDEIVAAVAYHIDERPHMPLLITGIGFRNDRALDQLRREHSLAGALVLKHHVHAIATKTGRGGYVDVDLPRNDDLLDLAADLGFKPAPKVRDFRPGGVHLRQAAPV
jgi:hypothetical protein